MSQKPTLVKAVNDTPAQAKERVAKAAGQPIAKTVVSSFSGKYRIVTMTELFLTVSALALPQKSRFAFGVVMGLAGLFGLYGLPYLTEKARDRSTVQRHAEIVREERMRRIQ